MSKLIFVSIVLFGFSAFAQNKIEKRCGWISNPTPANHWISDADGTWTIGVQGGYQADGIENIDFPAAESDKYVRTNGNYGYFCGCVDVETTRTASELLVLRVYSSQTKTLKACLEDYTLNSF